jgi:Immunoglobulin domain
VDDIPPPIIQIGPTNQTLPKGSVAMLPCRAAGTPSPEIKWMKDGTALQSKSRFVIVQSGTLKIDGEIFFTFFFVHFKKNSVRAIEEGRRNDLSFFFPRKFPQCFLENSRKDRNNCEID